jgi:acyl dehydratase
MATRALYLEDFQVGAVDEFGGETITKEDIVAFARSFDPQPFHVDEEAAKRSHFGGLIASGWHTTALVMRMMVARFMGLESGSLGSPGMDEIRWLLPVRPGDTLHVRTEVLEVKPSRSKPDRGVVRSGYRVTNQHGQLVMTMIGLGMFQKRNR